MIPSAFFPAKILLFGEYSILKGSAALAVPFFEKKGQLRYACIAGQRSPEAQESQQSLIRLFNYLNAVKEQLEALGTFDWVQFRNDLISGLFFDSDIPEGYGLGSSAALSAAVFDSYFSKEKKSDPAEIIESLALIESCFHQKSSGIDPLVSYFSEAIYVENKIPHKIPFRLEWLSGQMSVCLLDSDQPGSTKTQEWMSQSQILPDELLILTNRIINQLLVNETDTLWQDLIQLSQFQLKYFSSLFPKKVLELALVGLESGDYLIKLCGSGGGGFFLVFGKTPNQIPLPVVKSGLKVSSL